MLVLEVDIVQGPPFIERQTGNARHKTTKLLSLYNDPAVTSPSPGAFVAVTTTSHLTAPPVKTKHN